jgi:hypothetical protein
MKSKIEGSYKNGVVVWDRSIPESGSGIEKFGSGINIPDPQH